jgi:hypothetical protein
MVEKGKIHFKKPKFEALQKLRRASKIAARFKN